MLCLQVASRQASQRGRFALFQLPGRFTCLQGQCVAAGDYYEIDGNVWLTPEERAEVKQRQDLQEQVARQRRDKLVVTIDLLGRTVCAVPMIISTIVSSPCHWRCQ